MDVFRITADRLGQVERGPIAIADHPAIFEITGPGAEQCLQGLVTNDVGRPGPNSLIYGALLSPKGMIIADFWIARRTDGFVLITDRAAHDRALAQFRRLLPPRLARLTDRTDGWGVIWLLGPAALKPLEQTLGTTPGPGRLTATAIDSQEVIVGAPVSARAPFRHLVAGPAAGCDAVARMLEQAGVMTGTAEDLRVARVLAGFPTLDAEIDEKTMPSEVDFDALAGVAHDKGCYVGQETVARIHFRGHPNWLLRGLRFSPESDACEEEIGVDGKPAVRVGTHIAVNGGAAIGLGKVRREFEPGVTIRAGGRRVEILGLPFQTGETTSAPANVSPGRSSPSDGEA
jgi:folate-binding protein YgfZ